MMNGLLQIHSANTEHVQELLQVFSYSLPFDVYLSCLNTTFSALNCTGIDFDKLNPLPLCMFLVELTNFQYSILTASSVYLVDCFIKLNPNFNENQDEDRTIEEMQETIFE